jgi:WhiB family redox-sensing transcriptional regulator
MVEATNGGARLRQPAPSAVPTHMTLISPDHDSRSPTQMTWRNRSACLDESPDLFFPIGNNSSAHVQIQKAKAVCRRCAVSGECLKWSLESKQNAGVWGGLSDDERHALRRRDVRARRAS